MISRIPHKTLNEELQIALGALSEWRTALARDLRTVSRIFKSYSVNLILPCLLTVLCLLVGCGKNNGGNIVATREEIIKEAQEGIIKGDANGKAVLPDKLKKVSVGGEIYVATDPPVGLSIVFVLSATPDKTVGNLYCEKEIPTNTRTINIGSSTWNLQMVDGGHWALVNKL